MAGRWRSARIEEPAHRGNEFLGHGIGRIRSDFSLVGAAKKDATRKAVAQ